ncbi:unnamed protein product [Amoebophrya sp. A120]|nr:unnamed protein product [Amoebophrya sp. A120]|eukprot:GSA120T00000446001.1
MTGIKEGKIVCFGELGASDPDSSGNGSSSRQHKTAIKNTQPQGAAASASTSKGRAVEVAEFSSAEEDNESPTMRTKTKGNNSSREEENKKAGVLVSPRPKRTLLEDVTDHDDETGGSSNGTKLLHKKKIIVTGEEQKKHNTSVEGAHAGDVVQPASTAPVPADALLQEGIISSTTTNRIHLAMNDAHHDQTASTSQQHLQQLEKKPQEEQYQLQLADRAFSKQHKSSSRRSSQPLLTLFVTEEVARQRLEVEESLKQQRKELEEARQQILQNQIAWLLDQERQWKKSKRMNGASEHVSTSKPVVEDPCTRNSSSSRSCSSTGKNISRATKTSTTTSSNIQPYKKAPDHPAELRDENRSKDYRSWTSSGVVEDSISSSRPFKPGRGADPDEEEQHAGGHYQQPGGDAENKFVPTARTTGEDKNGGEEHHDQEGDDEDEIVEVEVRYRHFHHHYHVHHVEQTENKNFSCSSNSRSSKNYYGENTSYDAAQLELQENKRRVKRMMEHQLSPIFEHTKFLVFQEQEKSSSSRDEALRAIENLTGDEPAESREENYDSILAHGEDPPAGSLLGRTSSEEEIMTGRGTPKPNSTAASSSARNKQGGGRGRSAEMNTGVVAVTSTATKELKSTAQILHGQKLRQQHNCTGNYGMNLMNKAPAPVKIASSTAVSGSSWRNGGTAAADQPSEGEERAGPPAAVSPGPKTRMDSGSSSSPPACSDHENYVDFGNKKFPCTSASRSTTSAQYNKILNNFHQNRGTTTARRTRPNHNHAGKNCSFTKNDTQAHDDLHPGAGTTLNYSSRPRSSPPMGKNRLVVDSVHLPPDLKIPKKGYFKLKKFQDFLTTPTTKHRQKQLTKRYREQVVRRRRFEERLKLQFRKVFGDDYDSSKFFPTARELLQQEEYGDLENWASAEKELYGRHEHRHEHKHFYVNDGRMAGAGGKSRGMTMLGGQGQG